MIALKPRHDPRFTSPNPKRLPRRKLVTIAAGFVCDEGIVICSDTQETIPGYVKTDSEKMRTIVGGHLSMVFTGSGDADLIEMTIDEIQNRVILEQPHAVWAIEKIVKDALSEIFKKRIGPYSVFPAEDRPLIPDLLIGVQVESGTLLYKASGTKLRRLNEPECIGTGLVLGKSLIGRFFKRNLSLAQTGLLAIYILHQVKRWVDGCGGKSDILLLSNRERKIGRMPTDEVTTLEKDFDAFDEAVNPVLFAASNAAMKHDEYKEVMSQFELKIFGLRGKFMEMEEFFRRLYELRGIPMSKDMKDFVDKRDTPSTP